MVAGCGSGRFSGMYEDDWLDMSLCDKLTGCLVKFFPAINRFLNFFQFGSLLFSAFAIYVHRHMRRCDQRLFRKSFLPVHAILASFSAERMAFILCCWQCDPGK